jgi:uncharacterized FAD-dependent dehydrogenase
MLELQSLRHHDGLFRARVLSAMASFPSRPKSEANLPDLLGFDDKVQELIDYTDKIYLEFGADAHVEGFNQSQEVKAIRRRAIEAGLKLVDCPIRHLGTEKAHDLYLAIEQYLKKSGVEMLFGYECNDILLEKGPARRAIIHKYRRWR